MTTQAADNAVRTAIVVDAPVERAFRVFTEDIGSWWDPGHHILDGSCHLANSSGYRDHASNERDNELLALYPRRHSVRGLVGVARGVLGSLNVAEIRCWRLRRGMGIRWPWRNRSIH